MLPLPPPPPPPTSPPPPPTSPPPSERRSITDPLKQVKVSKQAKPQPNLESEAPNSLSRSRKSSALQHPRLNRTRPIVWCGAVLCLIFSLVLIFFGIATLVIFLVFRPRNPVFDVPNANLNGIYFDSPEYFNGDVTFIANFSNPSQKVDVRFVYADINLYFLNRLIGTQALQPFTQRPRETRLESVHIISSLVYLPENLAMELQKQVQSNRINYSIGGKFKVRANLGLILYSYWLHGRCDIEMTGPPNGVLVARSCYTKR